MLQMPTLTLAVGGSDGGATVTNVAREAAIKTKAALLAEASKYMGVPAEALDTKDSQIIIKGTDNAFPFQTFVIDGEGITESYRGSAPPYDHTGKTVKVYNLIFAEVEVDTETGQVYLTKQIGAADVGKAIRPKSVDNQIVSTLSWTQGVGLTEEYIYDTASGILLNGGFLDYKIPCMSDVATDTIPIIVETGLAGGCYGATGIGENLYDKGVIQMAVFNAIGKWIYDVPITPDKVLKALGKI